MDIVICISHVPDTTTKIQFKEGGDDLNKEGVTFVVNPYDEMALARGLELKEQGVIDGKVYVLCVGPKDVEPTIRKALAVGADEGIRVDAEAWDGMQVAKRIADYCKENEVGAVMMGKESIDNNGSEVPGMVAEYMGLPFISFATWLDLEDSKAIITREVQGGMEKVETNIPYVLSAQKGLAEWRIPNMRGIMMARKKPLHTVEASEVDPATKHVQYELPPDKGGCEFIDPENIDRVVEILEEKGAL